MEDSVTLHIAEQNLINMLIRLFCPLLPQNFLLSCQSPCLLLPACPCLHPIPLSISSCLSPPPGQSNVDTTWLVPPCKYHPFPPNPETHSLSLPKVPNSKKSVFSHVPRAQPLNQNHLDCSYKRQFRSLIVYFPWFGLWRGKEVIFPSHGDFSPPLFFDISKLKYHFSPSNHQI